MGGQYRITGDKYPRMRPPRRRGRIAVAVVASVGALGLIGWGTLQLIDVFTDGHHTSATRTPAACEVKASPAAIQAKAVPKPAQITVNVYNATTRSGLAKTTADELKKRGFKIGDVGNAAKEYDKKVKGSGLLLGPTAARDSALPVLATQLTDADRRTDATRKNTTLDLIIGDGFKNLTQRVSADQALTALSAPHPTATPKKGC
ncbi:LytR C-terminal domain-containing protein [Streptomyces sp. J2-1]|nr:LytR C-terminal domain-containing protein [Streptomyces corallincola]